MGDEDIVVTSSFCSYKEERRDCDGNYDTYCMKIGYCPYQRDVRDCDGDIISLCSM